MTATKKPLCVSILAPLVFILIFLRCAWSPVPFLLSNLVVFACAVTLIEILLLVHSVRELILCRPKWPSILTILISGVAIYFIGFFALVFLLFSGF